MPETEMRFEFILATFFRKIISASFLKKSYLFWNSDYFISGKKPFFIKKKKIWYISQARPFQFNKDHPSIFAPPRRRKTWCTPYLLHCTSEEPCFSSFNFMKERELYFAFFSVCMYSFLCSFAANWRVKIRKFCDFEKCILFGFSNCKFCNYWISKKKKKKKLVKQSAFFCIIQKNQQSLNSNCHSRKQTSEKKYLYYMQFMHPDY